MFIQEAQIAAVGTPWMAHLKRNFEAILIFHICCCGGEKKKAAIVALMGFPLFPSALKTKKEGGIMHVWRVERIDGKSEHKYIECNKI